MVRPRRSVALPNPRRSAEISSFAACVRACPHDLRSAVRPVLCSDPLVVQGVRHDDLERGVRVAERRMRDVRHRRGLGEVDHLQGRASVERLRTRPAHHR